MVLPLKKALLARQGIYDQQCIVQAYELLYRNNGQGQANVDNYTDDGDRATSAVLTQLFTNLDFENIIGDKKAFINFTHNHLVQKIPELLPRDKVVIEVLETVLVDKPLLLHLEKLKEKGYQIALDDFMYRDDLKPLLGLADIIKIDVLNLSPEHIAEQLRPISGFTGKLLAEKIEDKQQFNHCIDAGFDLFQGFFLNKPSEVKGQAITENKMQVLRLLSELSNDNVPLYRIEEIVLQIPKLSYRILRLANSASLYKGKKIESLNQAIYQLGLLPIRNWVNMLLLASADDLALDLLERTLIRAKMCELLALELDYFNPQQAYTVGILSTLDGILNEPMALLLAKVPLSDTLNAALLQHEGVLGQILKMAIDYEYANFNQLDTCNTRSINYTESYLKAISYANEVISILTL